MQVPCKVRSIRAADAEMQLVCVGFGLRALIDSLRGQIQLSAMNREKACAQAICLYVCGHRERVPLI